MFKNIFLLRTEPLDLSAWRSIYYAIVPINSAISAIILTAIFFLKGNCYPQVTPSAPVPALIRLYLLHSPIAVYFLGVMSLHVLLFLCVKWSYNGSFTDIAKRLTLRSAPLLTTILVALWYTDLPYSGRFICFTFHDRGLHSYHFLPPFLIYAGSSMMIGLWNVRQVGTRSRKSAATSIKDPSTSPGNARQE